MVSDYLRKITFVKVDHVTITQKNYFCILFSVFKRFKPKNVLAMKLLVWISYYILV